MLIFCRECNNLLYPKEDKQQRKLLLSCRNCLHEEDADDPLVYHNEIHRTKDDERTVVTHDISADPTLPRTKVTCPKCGHGEACFFQNNPQSATDNIRLYFVCTNCSHRWTRAD